MAVVISDGGRQLIVNATVTPVTVPTPIGPPCNFKIVDAWWQDTVAGTDTLSFEDAKGRTFSFKASSDLVPIAIGKLDWVEGPITILQMSSGILYFILGNK